MKEIISIKYMFFMVAINAVVRVVFISIPKFEYSDLFYFIIVISINLSLAIQVIENINNKTK